MPGCEIDGGVLGSFLVRPPSQKIVSVGPNVSDGLSVTLVGGNEAKLRYGVKVQASNVRET